MSDDLKARLEKMAEIIDRIDRKAGIEAGSFDNGRAWLETVAQRLNDDSSNGQHRDPFYLTVRGLLSHFGYERRVASITGHIRNTLDELGLQTIPNFEIGWIGNEIAIHLNVLSAGEDAPAQTVDATRRIGDLDAAHINDAGQLSLAYVQEQKPLIAATTIMQLSDFSQLPVMVNNTSREVKGIITWKSIGARLALGHECPLVKDCMEKPAQILPIDTPLIEAVGTIARHGYALIQGVGNVITGIVTASDLASEFENLAGPFVAIGEIEGHLRNLVEDKITREQMRDACADIAGGKEINSASDLTLGGYCALLQNPEYWTLLDLKVDRAEFCKHLDTAREIRNDVMHFNPDGVSRASTETLHSMARFFRDLAQMKAL